ncbi:MAG: Gfo/Idh/MocA family oxidoreductase [bacterium]|nr:Gfo/Idh/MocA family oxidoreductase [bacterium]
MIRIGIIGTGFGAKVHIPGFKTVRGVRILGIAGTHTAKTKEIAQKNNIPLAFDSWKKLVSHPDIDAISIVTPPHLHAAIALHAIKNGKHVLCEKPLAMNTAEAQRMYRAAEKAKVVHMTDFEFRNIPEWIYMRELLQKNYVGKIRHININWITGGRAGSHIQFSWQNDKKYGGGTLFALGSHIIDYIEWIFGPITSVSGNLHIAKKNVGGSIATADDICDILITLKDSTPITVSVSSVLPNGRGHWIEVYGEKGSLKAGNSNLKDSVYGFTLWHGDISKDTGKAMPIPTHIPKIKKGLSDGRLATFIKTAEQFIHGIQTHKNPRPSFADGARAQIILQAIQKSNTTRKWIRI